MSIMDIIELMVTRPFNTIRLEFLTDNQSMFYVNQIGVIFKIIVTSDLCELTSWAMYWELFPGWGR
jgi:hypothetical protein